MPEESDIEKQLREFARQRREQAGAPPELSPATRRMFHDEIERTAGKMPSAPGFWAELLASPWRLALGGGVALAIVILGFLLVPQLLRGPGKQADVNLQLAKKNVPAQPVEPSKVQPPQASANQPAQPAPTAASAPGGSAAVASAPNSPPDGLAAASARARLADSVKGPESNAPETALPRAESNVPPALASSADLNSNSTNLTGPSLAKTTSPMAAPAPVPVHYDRQSNLNGVGTDSTMTSLLRSFQLIREGDQVRLIDDADGSVYAGNCTNETPVIAIFAAAAPRGQSNLPQAPPTNAPGLASAAASAPPVNRPFSFTVKGTNVTLNQVVELTASVGLPPVTQARGARSAAGAGAAGGGLGGAAGGGAGLGGGGGFGGGGGRGGAGGAAGGRGGRGGGRGAFVATSNLMTGTVLIGTNQFGFSASATR